MANFIDYTYFCDQFDLAQVYSPANNLAFREDLARFISMYEPRFLKQLLGYDISDADCFYNLFMSGYSSEARFMTLKTKIVDTVNKISPITGYVYWQWVRFHRGKINTDNSFISIPANNTPINDNQILCDKWNWMVELCQEIHDYILENSSTYPEYSYSESPFEQINILGI